jgi:hypothetical protein
MLFRRNALRPDYEPWNDDLLDLGGPDSCDEFEPDEYDPSAKGIHTVVYGDEVDNWGEVINKYQEEKEREVRVKNEKLEDKKGGEVKIKGHESQVKEKSGGGRGRDPMNTPRHTNLHNDGSSSKRSSSRKMNEDDDEHDYMRHLDEDKLRSPNRPMRIIGERIRYSEVELNGTKPEDFRNFVKQLNIFERECNVPWDRTLIHKEVTGFLDLRWARFVREKSHQNLSRDGWLNVFSERFVV